MSIGLVPLPCPVLGVHHDRVHVVHGAVVLPGPLEVAESGVDGMACVEAAADPLADELLGLDGLELVVDGGDGGLVEVAVRLGQCGELRFGSVESSQHLFVILCEQAGRGLGTGHVRLGHSHGEGYFLYLFLGGKRKSQVWKPRVGW